MANTFFDFDTSLNNGDNTLPPDDEDCLENEEEYDALNDETFGALEDASSLDDWEQQHEQYAEIAESSKHSDKLENSISQLVLDDSEQHTPHSLSDSVWSYTPTSKNGDIFNTAILSSLQKASKSFIQTRTDSPSAKSAFTPADLNSSSPLAALPAQPRKICTVEELEKNLLQSSKQQLHQTQQQNANQQKSSTLPSPLSQHSAPPRPILPPPGHHPHPQGFPFHPLLQQHVHQVPPPPHLVGRPPPPPGMRGVMPPMLPPHAHHPRPGAGLPLPPQPGGMPHPGLLPPGLLRVMHPRFLAGQAGQQGGPPRPPGFGYPPPPHQQQPPPPPGHHGGHPYNFPPPPHGGVLPVHPQNRIHPHHQHQGQGQHQHQGQRPRRDSREDKQRRYDYEEHHQQGGDEYAGLMSAREKQWLLNIQMLQLNTGTPYFDDYYYTVFKERKNKCNKENLNDRNYNLNNNNNRRQHRNSDRQENQNTLAPRVYTPLQFENSLGKLQCGSVTAPRKIIDVDVVMCDKDNDTPQTSRDTRKTKQLLLELEALYALLLKAEDINNPLYVTNMEKLREIKQKQRLRELELAPTPEQKQEVLRLFKLESEPIVENHEEYISKILQGLLQDDKFSSFLNIRKGKMLILRLLPHLTRENFPTHLLDLWSKVLLSLPVAGRRDTAGDNILPKLYPSFKRYVSNSSMADMLEMTSGLTEVVKQENSRSTPLSHVGKPPLYFVVSNVFGLSALICLLRRVEYLVASDIPTIKQLEEWRAFLTSWAHQAEGRGRAVPEPIETVPKEVFDRHWARFSGLKDAKALADYICDSYS
nr:unnamed protein product [Callosobruchus chinensis]